MPACQATGGIDFLASILGLLKSLKIGLCRREGLGGVEFAATGIPVEVILAAVGVSTAKGAPYRMDQMWANLWL